MWTFFVREMFDECASPFLPCRNRRTRGIDDSSTPGKFERENRVKPKSMRLLPRFHYEKLGGRGRNRPLPLLRFPPFLSELTIDWCAPPVYRSSGAYCVIEPMETRSRERQAHIYRHRSPYVNFVFLLHSRLERRARGWKRNSEK